MRNGGLYSPSLGWGRQDNVLFFFELLVFKCLGSQAPEWKKNASDCITRHWKRKRGAEAGGLRHLLLMVAHALSQGNGLCGCLLLWCWEVAVHVNVAVVCWNNEGSEELEIQTGVTAGPACLWPPGPILQVWLSVWWGCGSMQSAKGMPAGPESERCSSASLSIHNPLQLSYLTWSRGSRLLEQVTMCGRAG